MGRSMITFLGLSGLILILCYCTPTKQTTSPTAAAEPNEAPEIEREPAFITAIKEKVKGKEALPAEEVFENIEILKGMEAGRVLPIMQSAFNGSLGVKCTHCHEFGNWASDTKQTKGVAREMWRMTGKINKELLSQIENLQSERPFVNCNTCHQGKALPNEQAK